MPLMSEARTWPAIEGACMRRLLVAFGAVLIVSGFVATPPASAQQQRVNFYVGYFTPHTFDARTCPNINTGNCDVLVADSLFLTTFNRFNGIDIGQFDYATFGGEWLFPVSPVLEGGLGIGFYQRTVPVFDTYNFNGTTNSEIVADLKLRVVPFSATVRFLPIGNRSVTPYVGGGVNVYYWRYSESGQFVD